MSSAFNLVHANNIDARAQSRDTLIVFLFLYDNSFITYINIIYYDVYR